MAYTAFRKSYGDFEVVIPPVDFSSLTVDEALNAARAFRDHQYGFVCSTLNWYNAHEARCCINSMLAKRFVNNVGSLIDDGFYRDRSIPFFGSCRAPGDTFRKAWCEHMAREIEREYGLEPNPYALEEH